MPIFPRSIAVNSVSNLKRITRNIQLENAKTEPTFDGFKNIINRSLFSQATSSEPKLVSTTKVSARKHLRILDSSSL